MRPPDEQPAPGDIVIRCIEQSPIAYAVGTTPGPPQILFRSYQQAVAGARRFAARGRVDVWFAEDGHELARIARHRVKGRERRD